MTTTVIPRSPSSPRIFLRLCRFLLPFRWNVALAVLLGIATILSSVGLMGTSAYIISAAALHPSIAALSVAIVGVRFFGIARGVFRYVERLVTHNLTFRILAALRTWLYAALAPRAPGQLLRERSGDLYTRIVADVETLEQFFVRVVEPPMVALGTTIALFLLLARFDQRLALAAVGFLILAGMGIPTLAHALSQRPGQRLITERAELNAAYVDTLQGMQELVAFGQEVRWQDDLCRRDREVRRRQYQLAIINALGNSLGLLLTGWATLATLIIAVPLIVSARIEGVLLATLILMTQAAFEAVMPLGASLQALATSHAAAARLFTLVDAPPEASGRAEPSPEPRRFDLVVRDLRFRYAPDEPFALDGISFTVPMGKLVAIVGPSGSGKTTMLHLLLRFWDYEEGLCALGGCDIRRFRREDLLRYVAVVSQQTHLFNTTIRQNLLLARPGAAPRDLARAIEQAQLDGFVSRLARGLETPIGENGLRLSGGERRRLAIARALLKDAPILLLDEPTAHLDTATVRALMDELTRNIHSQDKTALLITHRLDGLDAADEILVLENGRVVERGSHARLLMRDGLYRRMWLEQHGDAFSADSAPAVADGSVAPNLLTMRDESIAGETAPTARG